MTLTFAKATLNERQTIFHWLDNPHMVEFWDNSPEHRADIESFMKGRVEPSNYFNGIFTYWIGSIDDEPFALIMTSHIEDNEDSPQLWRQHLPKVGDAYSIDFGIGNEKYLGRGLAARTLKGFTSFFKEHVATSTTAFFIDPDQSNPKAKHVYEKAGFKLVGEYTNNEGYFEGQQSLLMILSI